MKKTIIAGGAVALALVSNPAFAADYWLVQWNDHSAAFFDRSTLITNSPVMSRAWLLTVDKVPKGQKPTYQRIFIEFDCAQHQSRLLAFVGYNADGTVKNSLTDPAKSTDMAFIIPESAGDYWFRAVCAPGKTEYYHLDAKESPYDVAQILFEEQAKEDAAKGASK